MTPEEYQAYEESSQRDFANMPEEAIRTIDGEIYDDIKREQEEYEYVQQQLNNNNSNDNGGVQERGEGGGSILREEQPVEVSAGDRGIESERRAGQDGYNQDEPAQEEAGGTEEEQVNRLSDEEISTIIDGMENLATDKPSVEYSKEEWDKRFKNPIETPVGRVRMGEHQFGKLHPDGNNNHQDRRSWIGIIYNTLTSPNIIVEQYDNVDGAERDYKYVFVKSFLTSSGESVTYFTSVTVKKGDMEVVITNHFKKYKDIRKLLKEGKLCFSSISPSGIQTEPNRASASVTTSETDNNPGVSENKNSIPTANKQAKQTELSENVLSTSDTAVKDSQRIAESEQEVDVNPTDVQKEAGNYKKGHLKLKGFDITIENPAGSVRSGVDRNGSRWENRMNNTYGYFKGTQGVDGDHIDVYLSNDMDNWSGDNVYVIDQYNPDGSFDEHKVMFGFDNKDEALSNFLANYSQGWGDSRKLDVTPISMDGFKKWVVSSHRKTKPFASYKVVKALTEDAYGKTDKQGNPLNDDGTLKLEKITSVDELTDEDFSAPTRSVELPALPKNVDDAIGANGKPVIIKKNIFEKNWKSHKFPFDESRKILKSALYDTDLVGQTQPVKKPLHWVAIKLDDKSPIVILEVNESKDNTEIVGWYTLDERNLERIKRQANKNGGELIVLSPKDKVESLPTPLNDLSSVGNITDNSANSQMSGVRNDGIDEDAKLLVGEETLPEDELRQRIEDGRFGAMDSQESTEKNEKPKERPKEKIEDVGEKIGGARKDIIRATADRIDINGETFSKIFPKFDFKKLIQSGLDPKLASGLKFIYDHSKESFKSKKRSRGEIAALNETRFIANYAKGYLLGDTSVDYSDKGWVFTAYGKELYQFNTELYNKLHEVLGDDMFDIDLGKYFIDVVPDSDGSKGKSSAVFYRDGKPIDVKYIVKVGDTKLFTKDEHDDAVKFFLDKAKSSVNYKKANPYKLAVYYFPRKKGSYYIGTKIGGKVVALTPEGKEYNYSYIDEHRAELQAAAERMASEMKDKAKSGENKKWKPEMNLGNMRDRVGMDYRKGRSVSAKELMDKFGFRGIEFGNYVTQKERQQYLNECYDAFMDMAGILGISPKAISIDGKLALAVGARGTGKASAHYEPAKHVINLTKAKSAGTLAHEWWHAMDFHFGRKSSSAPSTDNRFDEETRTEVRKAIESLMDKIKDSDYYKRSKLLDSRIGGKDYYSTNTELAARAFQD